MYVLCETFTCIKGGYATGVRAVPVERSVRTVTMTRIGTPPGTASSLRTVLIAVFISTLIISEWSQRYWFIDCSRPRPVEFVSVCVELAAVGQAPAPVVAVLLEIDGLIVRLFRFNWVWKYDRFKSSKANDLLRSLFRYYYILQINIWCNYENTICFIIYEYDATNILDNDLPSWLVNIWVSLSLLGRLKNFNGTFIVICLHREENKDIFQIAL